MKLDEEGNKRKLSKRKDPELALTFYAQEGYPVPAVLEYLMTLLNSNFEEWRRANPDLPMNDFPFTTKKMSGSGALFDIEKLRDVSKNVISRMTAEQVYDYVAEWSAVNDKEFNALLTRDPAFSRAYLAIGRGGKKPRKDLALWSDAKGYMDFMFDELFRPDYTMPERVSAEDAKAILADFAGMFDENDTPDGFFDKMKQIASAHGYAADTKAYKVAIIKQLDHASLDEIANAVTAELDQISADKNVKIEYEVTSGQGDQTILKQLSDQAIADGVDAIIPIATTAAQIAALSAEETKTPVVYAAVSDPETAKLTGIDYVTGTSDALNTDFIMDMMFAQNPNTAKVGLLYSLSEPNSAKPIADAKAYLDTKGIEYVEQTANTNDEVVAAASALIAAGVDAVFTPTDNVIMAAELAIYEDLAKNGIPHYTGADSFVRNGAYATCGVNYTDLGTQTADLAYTDMTEGMDGMEDYYLMDGGIITVNTDTCALIGKQADYACFNSKGEVVEVTTTKD